MKNAPMWNRLAQVGIAGACRASIFRLSNWRAIVLALILSCWQVGGHAQAARFRYVSLDQIALPAGFTQFLPSAIADNGRVYGTLCDAVCGVTQLAYVKDGQLSVLPSPAGSFSGPVNSRGTIGGSILVDPVNFYFRAALFQGDRVTVIPPQPGEVSASVLALNDNDTALVASIDASGNLTYVLYRNGTAAPINFGSSISNPFFTFFGSCRCINNTGLIEGIEGPGLYNGARGFRFDPRNGNATILAPFPGDPSETLAWGQAINQAGNVLGYSFTAGSPYHERIGVWGANGVFYTWLVESDSSNLLLFNDNNLIVITAISATYVSYLVPQPGVRLDLSSLVVNLPAGQDLYLISDLNNHGDMIGVSSTGANFLLIRLDTGDSQTYAKPLVNNARHTAPPVIAIMRGRLQPKSGQMK
ncbi:hypothetical protein [Paraburkholderia pallida]|uniref:Uncharacterized protein n=1 Tax=Paraburkholderia pallida TaxID=2547399 RepID=A0A4P7CZZ4_9BURK|nr:hypothetical protein [Paraburkholderia pallida]QBR01961.1 hypothetical protein E1956_33055 [Paraburkholderia pallida]